MTTKHLMRTLFLSLCGLLLWTMPAHATTLIDENFEVTAGNIRSGQQTYDDILAKGWTINNFANPAMGDIVTSPVHGGSKALRYQYPGIHCTSTGVCDDTGNMQISRVLPDLTEFYDRYWARFECTGSPCEFVDGHGGSSSKQHYFNPGGQDVFFIFSGPLFSTGATNSMAFQHGASNGAYTFSCARTGTVSTSCNLTPNAAAGILPFNQWVCLESHHKLNTPGVANGIVEAWLDGILYLQYTNVMFVQTQHTAARFKLLRIYRQGGNNLNRFEDDYMMATTRVGCGGAPPPPSDTTAPATPTGLAVQ